MTLRFSLASPTSQQRLSNTCTERCRSTCTQLNLLNQAGSRSLRESKQTTDNCQQIRITNYKLQITGTQLNPLNLLNQTGSRSTRESERTTDNRELSTNTNYGHPTKPSKPKKKGNSLKRVALDLLGNVIRMLIL